MPSDFGAGLREWRERRRLSQLELGSAAAVSARHISFLETGRARPSRGMVLRLCDHLRVPRAARNRLLTAAGLAPAYAARPLAADDLGPLREAVDWMLARHAPYPAFALDRHWTLTAMNPPAATLFGAVGLGAGDSLVAALADNARLRAALENLDAVIAAAIARLRVEAAELGGDPVLEAGIQRLAGAHAAPVRDDDGVLPAFIPTRYRLGERTLSLVSTLAQFGGVDDLTLAELRVELLFPADAASRAWLVASSRTARARR
jgi:transcriptional regulator with XRE-family HTH domain